MRLIVLVWLGLLSVAASAQEPPAIFTDLTSRAQAAVAAGDTPAAIGLYSEAVGLQPTWREGWWMLGSLQYEADQYAACANSLARLVKLTPEAGPAWAILGLCEYGAAQYDRSAADLERGATLGLGDKPQLAMVINFHQALLLTRQGRFDEALQKYSSFLPKNVTDEEALLGLGLTNLRVKATPPEIAPRRKDIYLLAGRTLAEWLTGDKERAEVDYRELVTRYPNDPGAHFAYGFYLFGSDQDAALREWKKTIDLDPSNTAAHSMIAWADWLREDTKEAGAEARAALSHDPDSVLALVVMGRVLVHGADSSGGVKQLERAVSIAPANLEAHLALATAYSEAGRTQESRRERVLCMKMQFEATPVENR